MTRYARIVRDLCLIGVGVLTFIDRPPSVAEAGLSGPAGWVWASMIGLGAVGSLYGVTFRNITAEVFGCAAVGGGFLIWAFTSVIKPDATLVSWALALVFLSGTAGQAYRCGMLTEGRVDRR